MGCEGAGAWAHGTWAQQDGFDLPCLPPPTHVSGAPTVPPSPALEGALDTGAVCCAACCGVLDAAIIYLGGGNRGERTLSAVDVMMRGELVVVL